MHINYSFNYSVWILLIGVFTSGHVLVVDSLGLRLPLQVMMIGMLLAYIFQSIGKKINKSGLIVVYVAMSCLVGDLIMRQDVNDIMGYLLLVAFSFTLLVMKPQAILEFISKLNHLNWFFATCSIIAIILSINSVTQFNALFEKAPYYSTSFLSGVSWQSLLSHADTEQTLFGIMVPRISAHLQQASLIPAYFMLPLAISLAFAPQNKMFITVTILLFCILSTGGTVYVALASGILIYLIGSYIPRVMFLIMPFILLAISSSLLLYFFIDAYDVDALKGMSRSVGEAWEASSTDQSPISQRLGSGLVRLALMGFQTAGFIESFPLPANTALVKMTIGGNLLTNGLRGGLVGLVFTGIMYYSIFYAVSGCLKKCHRDEKSQRLGFSMIYALVFQSFIYNDFGFSTYYGYMMFIVILVLANAHLSGLTYHRERRI